MTAYAIDYKSDIERTHYAVTLYTSFELEAGQQTVLETDLLPPSFVAAIQPESGCTLRFTPRRAVLYLSDVERFILPLPWRGGTPEYSQILMEIEQNPRVKALDILSEVIPPYQVLVNLGMVS